MLNRVCLITGAGGLIGSEAVKYFSDKFDTIVGIDCNARQEFFGEEASVFESLQHLEDTIPNFIWKTGDITQKQLIDCYFKQYGAEIDLIIHCAAQPSHDWAASNPSRDFEVNAVGTLNILEACRKYCPEAVFIFTSTNKVYGDLCQFKYKEMGTRYEINLQGNELGNWYKGFDENTPLDHTMHSVFGVSKTAADLMVQEYARYFGIKTGVFRGGCLTGPNHKGTMLHGFLSYLVKCIKHQIPYTIYGHKAKQVRDIIHAHDVITAFDEFYKNPRPGEVYNIGGGREINVSMHEAINEISYKTGMIPDIRQDETARKGDHQWYISDMSKFKSHYPSWNYTYTLHQIIDEIIQYSKI